MSAGFRASSTTEFVVGPAGERDVEPFLVLVGVVAGLDCEGDGQRPRQAEREVHVVYHALVIVVRHEAFERAHRTHGDHFEICQLAVVKLYAWQRLSPLNEIVLCLPLDQTVDEPPAVRPYLLDRLLLGWQCVPSFRLEWMCLECP